MIRFYFHPTPNPPKISLFLEEAGLPYEVVPVDTSKGEQHRRPSGKSIRTARCRRSSTPTDPAVKRRVCSIPMRSCSTSPTRPASSAVRLMTGRNSCPGCSSSRPASARSPARRCTSSWSHPPAPDYAVNRYRREAERHYQVVDDHLAGRDFVVGDSYTIADMSLWGWIDRAARVMHGAAEPLGAYPNIKRWFASIDARPAVARARAVGTDHAFKTERDEQALRALFPSNYPRTA